MNNEPRTILLTGGAGFIGSHIAKRLMKIMKKMICCGFGLAFLILILSNEKGRGKICVTKITIGKNF